MKTQNEAYTSFVDHPRSSWEDCCPLETITRDRIDLRIETRICSTILLVNFFTDDWTGLKTILTTEIGGRND